MNPPKVSFEAADSEDAEAISALSRAIWERHYRPDILTESELEYFWQRGYHPAQLQSHMLAGARYEWIRVEERRVGFLAYRIEADTGRVHLSKLYLDPDFHGKGYGAAALSRVQWLAATEGLREVYLYVFRNNTKAVWAYTRAGFTIDRTEKTECGEGYRYDDYVMVYRVLPVENGP
jgi:diamine N-acetyltransferase